MTKEHPGNAIIVLMELPVSVKEYYVNQLLHYGLINGMKWNGSTEGQYIRDQSEGGCWRG